MKKLTVLLTSMMMLVCMAAAPVQAEHTFENARTDEYCKELLETCSDCYTLNADGVYTYTNCVYHTGRNMFEPYLPEPGTYDRSDLLLSLARIHPESKYLVKIRLNGEVKGEPSRLAENGISIQAADDRTVYAVMTAEQVENFPASEKVGYLLSLSAPLEAVLSDETTAPIKATEKPTEGTQYPTDYADDVAPMTDYDGTPLTVGETRRIHLTHRLGRKLTNVYLLENGHKTQGYLEWTFDEETSDLVVTAIRAKDDLKVDIGAKECAFPRQLVMQIHEASTTNAAAVKKQGDLNGDGVSDIMDVIRLNKALLGVEQLTDEQSAAADLDGDGKMAANDALVLLKQILGITEQEQRETSLNLAASYAAQPVQTVDIDENTILGQTKFALDLLRESAEPGKNSLVSPYSVSQALGMTANGAAGNTLQEMETVLGGSMNTLNPAFYTLRTRDTKDAKCVTANSIWMKDSFFAENPVNPAFLQTNADYYGADVFSAPLDNTTLEDINNWVNDKTDKMIPEILDEIPDDAAMYLVNAVAFDAEWENPYGGSRDGKFMAADGTEQAVKMMTHDNYNRYYYETAHGAGFRENYKGGQYYFAAFLPETGMTPEEFLASMTAEELHETLQNPKMGRVYSTLPKFTYDFDIELNAPLSTMGMPSAFQEGPASDFSRVYADNSDRLYISRVLHKTHIEILELGTRAGAATAVELTIESASNAYMDFNRPFLYMIADSETNLPVFIGIVNSVA